MIKFLGNTGSIINWDDVIAGLERYDYESHPGPNDPIPDTGPTHKAGDPIPLLNQVTDIWINEGYKTVETGGTVQWDMFFPGKHYDQSVQDKFCEIFEITPKSSSWISRIRPGRQAPIHWDVNDDEEELLKKPDAVRWHCHIGKPAFGHVFVCENEVFYNRQQGDVFQWDSRRYWHAGSNCGLVPKYMFNLW
jgi:hypothetical protein